LLAEAQLVVSALAPQIGAAERSHAEQFLRSLGASTITHEQVAAGTVASCACERWTIHTPGSLERVRDEARRLQVDFDLAVQSKAQHCLQPRLLAADMDSTLTTIEGIDELARLAGVGEQVEKITAAAMEGKLDFQQSFRERVALLKGLTERALADVLDKVQFSPGAERLLRALKSRGCKMAVLSGGFSFVADLLIARLDIDYACTNRLEIRDGELTGDIVGDIVDGDVKARKLQEIARAENIPMEQTIAIGDGANDIAMLKQAGLGVGFRPKPKVREQAPVSLVHVGLDAILHLIAPA
jgi:phosphoserine phosphatase